MQSIIRTIRNKYVSIHGNYWSTIWPVASGAGGPGGGWGWDFSPPFFCQTGKPISTRGADYAHHSTKVGH